MRRAHDPSCFRRRGQRLGRHPQQQTGDAGRSRGQCQLAAGDKIELSRWPPDFQHDDAKRIAGERIGSRPQRGVHIRRTHRHQKSRIKAEFGQSAHRQRTRFNFSEILTYPHQRPPGRRPSREACPPREVYPPREAYNEPGGRGTLPSLGEHLVHRADGEAALQCSICVNMTECHPVEHVRIAVRLDALNAAAQSRKRARACGGA
jgi:hypothetical protein